MNEILFGHMMFAVPLFDWGRVMYVLQYQLVIVGKSRADFFTKIYNHVIWILLPGDLDMPNWTWSGLVRGKDGVKDASVFVPAILEAKWCAEHGASFCIFGKSGSCWANIPIAFLVVRVRKG